MDSLEFQNDETNSKRCGEIFLTNQGLITIHCTLCEVIYKNFDLYVEHLSERHYNDLDSKEEDFSNCYSYTNSEKLEPLDEDILAETQEEKISLTNEALNEEEITFEFLKGSKSPLKAKVSLPKNNSNFKTNKKIDLQIPEVIRTVQKRTLISSEIIPTEERKHKCPICDLAFKDRNNMRQHFRRHSNEKNHKCPECEKTFYTSTEVKIHIKSHTKERNYLCSDCGKSYKTNFQLTCHIKRHKNQRDFKCEICDKAFFDNQTLKDHMVVHTSARPFVCKICANSFPRALALKNHMKLHENRRAYKCKLCKAAFNQQAGLVSHMKVAHKNN